MLDFIIFLSATLLTKSFLLSAAYTFLGAKDKKWSALKNDYEITFDANSVVEPAADDADIKVQSYHFIKIATIADLEVNTTVDVIGFIRSFGDAQELVSKASGKALHKRTFVLTDDSGFDVRVTLWGEKANDLDNLGCYPTILPSQKYNCHISVGICTTVSAVKYLYKYVYKGGDRAAVYLVELSFKS